MKRYLFCVALFFTVPLWAQTPADIEFMIDASGSMEALLGSNSQMDVAKKSLKDTIANIPASVPVALRAYGHRVPKSDKENSCKDTELLIPFQPLGPGFSAKVDSLKPNGYTPIAFSLKQAGQDFLGREFQHVIILLSDGEETCGGDPVQEAKNLLAQGFKVTIHTIGFRVDEKTRAQLAAISQTTGGSYFDAKDAASLTQNLLEATQKALVIAKPKEEGRGQEIRGGNQYTEGVLLEPNVEYRLDHHQKGNQYDYFYVPLKRGQSLTATITTLDHGVGIQGEKAQENINPYAGIRVVGSAPDYQQIAREVIIGGQHAKKTVMVMAVQEGNYYVLLGNEYSSQHKDSPFKIEIGDHSDANAQKDAGDDFAAATPVALGDYPSNWIFFNQDRDVYQFSGMAGQPYTVKVTPKEMEARMAVKIYDQDRVQLAEAQSPNGGAVVRLENVVSKSGGTIYVEIVSHYTYKFPFEYEFALSSSSSGGETSVATAEGQALQNPSMGLPSSPSAMPPPIPSAKSGEGNKLLYLLLGLAVLLIAGLGVVIVFLLRKK